MDNAAEVGRDEACSVTKTIMPRIMGSDLFRRSNGGLKWHETIERSENKGSKWLILKWIFTMVLHLN